jgi:hypothetical protein
MATILTVLSFLVSLFSYLREQVLYYMGMFLYLFCEDVSCTRVIMGDILDGVIWYTMTPMPEESRILALATICTIDSGLPCSHTGKFYSWCLMCLVGSINHGSPVTGRYSYDVHGCKAGAHEDMMMAITMSEEYCFIAPIMCATGHIETPVLHDAHVRALVMWWDELKHDCYLAEQAWYSQDVERAYDWHVHEYEYYLDTQVQAWVEAWGDERATLRAEAKDRSAKAYAMQDKQTYGLRTQERSWKAYRKAQYKG